MTAMGATGLPRRPMSSSGWAKLSMLDVVAMSATALRPVIVTVAVFAAALGSTPCAHADTAPVLNGVGIGSNGPISSAIAGVGQSICPMLIQPGSSFASNAAQVSGHGGLAPSLAGLLAAMAIQAQCPSFMSSIADGNVPFPITGAAQLGMPFGTTTGRSPVPLQPPGL
jgi:hypothetical protein